MTFSAESDRIIKVLACGHCKGREELVPEPGRVLDSEYVIHYFTKGKGSYTDDVIDDCRFEDDHIVIFYPGFRHLLNPRKGEMLEHYYVLFSGNLPRILLRQLEEKKMAIFPIRPNPEYRDRFVEMMACTRSPTPLAVHRANALLHELINETVSLYQNGAGNSEAVEAYFDFVAENFKLGELDTDGFLGQVGLSRKTFGTLFKEEIGITPYQYWLSYKIAQAKLLLSGTDKSVKEIAYELGFRDEFYFSRLFKRKESIAPTIFRDSLYR